MKPFLSRCCIRDAHLSRDGLSARLSVANVWYVVLVASWLPVMANAATNEVIFRDGDEVLTKQMLLQSFEQTAAPTPETIQREKLMRKAGSMLLPYYYDIMMTTDHPLAAAAATRLMYEAEDPMKYRAEIMDVLLRPAFSEQVSTGIIGVLDIIGTAEDAHLVLPYLVDADQPRIRLAAAQVLAKIGDEDTLEAIEALRPVLERIEAEGIEELPSLREEWISRGRTPERADQLVESDRLERERVRRGVEQSIQELRRRIAGGPESEAADIVGTRPPVIDLAHDEERAVPRPQPSSPETKLEDKKAQQSEVVSAEEFGRDPAHAAIVAAVALFAALSTWLLLHLRKHQSR